MYINSKETKKNFSMAIAQRNIVLPGHSLPCFWFRKVQSWNAAPVLNAFTVSERVVLFLSLCVTLDTSELSTSETTFLRRHSFVRGIQLSRAALLLKSQTSGNLLSLII